MWVPIVAILSAVAYLLSKVARRGNADNQQTVAGQEPWEAN
jgi:hypothetical protein